MKIPFDKAKIKLFVLIILSLLAFWPIIPELFKTWIKHSNNCHGIIVPFISIYLIINRKIDFNKEILERSNFVLMFFSISLVIYLVSYIGGIAFVSRIMMVCSIILLVWYNYGGTIFKELRFPLLFLFYMVPIPQSLISIISLPMQSFATVAAAGLIKTLSIPVLREGNMLYFVNTQLEVAEACSGIRSIIALLMIATLLVYFSNKNNIKNIIMVISAFPIALLVNIIRVGGTGILANFFGDQVARGFLHEFSGIVVFFLGLMILIGEFILFNRGEN